MTGVYFGEAWNAHILDGMNPVPTPVGDTCLRCREPIVDGDRGFIRAVLTGEGASVTRSIHAECEALGIVGHEYGICSCTGYDTTSRQAAKELWARLRLCRPATIGIPHPKGCHGD